MSETVADDLIQSGYRRWLHLEEAKAEIADDLKELMAELKSHGLVPKALRESFRRVRDQDNADKQEHDAMVDLYVECLTRGMRGRARENIEEFPSATVADRVDMGNPMSANSERLDRGAVNGDVSDPTDVTEAGSDGLTSVAQTNSHSSEPISSSATTDKAEAASLLPSASATISERSVGGGDDRTSVEEVHNPNLEEGAQQAPSLPDNDFEPPSFLLKSKGPLRPHCLNPDLCAGVGRNHCWSCRKASGLSEVA